MKSMRLLALVTIYLFIFSANVFGQQACDPLNTCKCNPAEHNCGDITIFNTQTPGTPGCTDCGTKSCALGSIPCDKGQVQLFPFDYDGEPYEDIPGGQGIMFSQRGTLAIHEVGSYGYCTAPINFNDNAIIDPYNPNAIRGPGDRDCKFLFDICWCPEACLIDKGTYMGIQMIIDADGDWTTTDDGVYFADAPAISTIGLGLPNPYDPNGAPRQVVNPAYEGQPTVYFQLGEQKQPLCALRTMGINKVYLDAANDVVPDEVPVANGGRTEEQVRNFGPVSFFYKSGNSEAYTDTTTRLGQTNYFITTPAFRMPRGVPNPVGAILPENRVTVLQSGYNPVTGDKRLEADYMFNAIDVDMTHCWVWVDIPPMRIDPEIAKPGATIRVKVRFLFHKERFICENCAPPEICECVQEIATICCGAAPNNTLLLYPYFTEMDESGGYWSGIAITNRGDKNGTAKLTVYESDGDVATMDIAINAHSVYANLLSQIFGSMTLSTSVNGRLGNSRCYINVNTDFLADGFAMFGEYDHGWSLGYIPRVNP